MPPISSSHNPLLLLLCHKIPVNKRLIINLASASVPGVLITHLLRSTEDGERSLTAGARTSSCVKASYVLVNHAILVLHVALLVASTRTTLDAVGREPPFMGRGTPLKPATRYRDPVRTPARTDRE